ncbi:MAG: deoxyribodipyrimidine photo-lyase [Candidatus Thermoplasmatota archaeon]|nr:deoxyribodipyrimidine photo-lyase [Candidatus Thermoplasmatota archaeon]
MIHPDRIEQLNTNTVRPGDYVVYWMQASQRTLDNHALEYAVRKANELSQPLVVFFGLTSDFPEANERHYLFMLQGLQETAKTLQTWEIPFIIQQVSPENGVVFISKKASLVVTDKGYLQIQRQWRQYAAQHIRCPLIQIESDVIVPINTASQKEEYAAATLRPKIKKQLKKFLHSLRLENLQTHLRRHPFDSFDLSNLSNIISLLPIDHHVKSSNVFHGGTSHALLLLEQFIRQKLSYFSELRNDPGKEYCSHMSPYLHYGQISPLTIALQLLATHDPNTEAYLEELIIRRELSMNYVYYNSSYDSFEGLPSWAKQTLLSHAKDKRPYLYSREKLEAGNTHDSYWNAAQHELIKTGKMQGYMRMYWGKKILEWTQNPKEAFRIALFLNNKYELDGRDPNGFTGVAWCFGKHDRAWQERPIFGKVRYMNAAGLTKKFDMDVYIKKSGLL